MQQGSVIGSLLLFPFTSLRSTLLNVIQPGDDASVVLLRFRLLALYVMFTYVVSTHPSCEHGKNGL